MEENKNDKNSLIGFALIGLILMGYFFYQVKFGPQPEEQKEVSTEIEDSNQVETLVTSTNDTVSLITDSTSTNDSLVVSEAMKLKFGGFAANQATATEKDIKVETDLLELTFSTKGGMLKDVVLKDYKTFDSLPLHLFAQGSNSINYGLTIDNHVTNTKELIYQYDGETSLTVSGDNAIQLTFKAIHSNGKSIEHTYSIAGNKRNVTYRNNFNGLADNNIQLTWNSTIPKNEKAREFEQQNSGIYYRTTDEDVDYIEGVSDDSEADFDANLQWVSFKDQFFTAILFNKHEFLNSKLDMKVLEDEKALKNVSLVADLNQQNAMNQDYEFEFYFGSTDYDQLKEEDKAYQDIVPYGWGIFEFFNVYFTLPVAKFLTSHIGNYGVIIFLIALMVKLMVSPFTYKTYLSSIKMRVLKPELDEIKEKYKDDAQKQQQEQFKLYGKAGVNPLGGCIPMLFQMPILFAMFRFFPASIDLRQKSFFWATDLSSYDSIFNIGFDVPFYGDHVSAFTLLMTVTTILSTKANSQQMPDSGNNQMAAQMKIMQYVMPIMFLGIFNSYACALSIYYTFMNCLTLVQQFVIKRFIIDEDKIHAQIKERQSNPNQKKSKFRAKLDEMMDQQQQQAKKK